MSRVAPWLFLWLLKGDVKKQSCKEPGSLSVLLKGAKSLFPPVPALRIDSRQQCFSTLCSCLMSGKGSLTPARRCAVHGMDRNQDSNHKTTLALA